MLDIEWYPLEKITQTTGDYQSFTGVYMVHIQGIYLYTYIYIYTRYIYIYIYKVDMSLEYACYRANIAYYTFFFSVFYSRLRGQTSLSYVRLIGKFCHLAG